MQGMFIYIDEAGDVGDKVGQGSSRFFVLSMIVFEDREKALACDEAISQLRAKMKKPAGFEFHFTKNSDRVRKEFLEITSKSDFMAFSLMIDKATPAMKSPVFRMKDSFYFNAFNLLFASAAPFLSGQPLTVTLDESGSNKFQTGLRKYLKSLQEDNPKYNIKRFRQKKSDKDNLLQLADYFSGVVSRKAIKKRGWERYYALIEKKLLIVTKYP